LTIYYLDIRTNFWTIKPLLHITHVQRYIDETLQSPNTHGALVCTKCDGRKDINSTAPI